MKIFVGIKENYDDTNISNNIVDKDIQSLFSPLNKMQLMFSPKYRFRNSVIVPNSFFENSISFVGVLIVLCCSLYCVYIENFFKGDLENHFSFLSFTVYYDCIYFCFGFTLFFIVELIYTKKSIKFVLIFQKVHRFINNEIVFKLSKIWVWMSWILILVFYTLFFFSFCMTMNLPFTYIYSSHTLALFDLKVLYEIRIIKLLEQKVALWNVQALATQELEEDQRRNVSKQLFQAYCNILDCYNIFKANHQLFVSIELKFNL